MSIAEIVGLIIAVITALLATPWGAGAGSGYANHLKQTRALARIKGFGKIKPEAKIHFYSADAGGGSSPIAGGDGDPWVIDNVGTRITMSRAGWSGYNECLQLTAVEFEKGVAVVLEEEEPRDE